MTSPAPAEEAASNLADLVRAAAASAPAHPALLTAAGASTWQQLDTAIDRGVDRLAELPAGARVVLGLPTGPELAAGLFAVLRAGLVAVPVDPARTDLQWAAERVDAAAAITDQQISGVKIVIPTGEVAEWWDARDRGPSDTPQPRVVHARSGGEDLALLARASRPAPPVMLSHRALIGGAQAISGADHLQLRPSDRVLQMLPLYHVVGLVTAFLPAALARAAVVIPDSATAATPVEAALAAIRAHRVSVLPAEPTLYRQLDRIEGFERALASVRLMTSGSSPLDPADLALIRTATGQAVREGYGISESAAVVTSTLMTPTARAGSVGLPYPGIDVRIVGEEPPGGRADGADETAVHDPDPTADGAAETGADDDRTRTDLLTELTDLPDLQGVGNDVGPIAIRGATLFSGYWPDGHDGPGTDGWYVTGDLGYLDDAGELHLVDRAAETITVSGFTVYPREVEDAIVAHPLVVDAAVVGIPGADGMRVVAALVPKPGARPTADDVADFVAETLPPFKRPTGYELVDVLPRTEVGRLDRQEVRRGYARRHGIELDVPAVVRADVAEPGSSPEPAEQAGDLTERAADLTELGRNLPSAEARYLRSARDTDDDLF